MDIYDVLDALTEAQFKDVVLDFFTEEELQKLADYAVQVYDLEED